MKYLSLFSGIGGFEYGISQSNKNEMLQNVGFSEIDSYAENIYRKHFPDHPRLGDAREIDTENLQDFDLLVGGFPCQSFSYAGKRRGFDDTRGTLFFEIARILHDKKPKYFLLENVPGLLSNKHGTTFQKILRILSEEGYNVQWEIINSKDHGVPQNRQRVYIKGFLRKGKSGSEVLSQPKTNSTNVAGQGKSQKDNSLNWMWTNGRSKKLVDSNKNSLTLTGGGHNSGANQLIVEKCIGSTQKNASVTDGTVTPTLTASMGVGGGHVPMVKLTEVDEKHQIASTENGDFFTVTTSHRQHPLSKKQDNYVFEKEDPKINIVGNVYPSGGQAGYVYDENGLVGTLGLCSGGKGGEGKIVRIRNNTIKGYLEAEDGDGLELGQKNGRGIVQKQSIPTLNCTGSTGVLLKDNEKKITKTETEESKGTINGFYIRKLTPIETERLQGFPDNWTKTGADGTEISNTQRYKCCGNAVTTNVITYIMNNWEINDD